MNRLAAIAVLLALTSPLMAQTSLVVPSGTTLLYDTSAGPLLLTDLTIESGAVLRASGPLAFRVLASRTVQIDGLLDVSGFNNPGVSTLNTTNIPEPGAFGGPGGGRGGTGSPLPHQSSPSGMDGFGPAGYYLRVGGRGGESGISSTLNPSNANLRRPGGGGGGVLAADQPLHPNPSDPLNLGLIAGRGHDGWITALGVLTLTPPPMGGALGERVFVDADPTNDFFGRQFIPATGAVRIGELSAPVAGAGGGGGGDAINGIVWPPPVFIPTGDEKGAGGGGGGGLCILNANRIVVGAQGRIRCDGGRGGGGENINFVDRVGGGSGGGSGGYVILQARAVDLSLAADRCLTALGGRGGAGKDDQFQPTTVNAGGNGGPGVISIHLQPPIQPILPPGKTLADLSQPRAYVLMPDRRL